MQNDVIAPDLERCSVQWASRGGAAPCRAGRGQGQASTKLLVDELAVVRAGRGLDRGRPGGDARSARSRV